jgi:hypothetical protein
VDFLRLRERLERSAYMAGRKPHYRLVRPRDNGKGVIYPPPIGVAWRNENKGTGEVSISITINSGADAISLKDGAKLVLFEDKESSEERPEDEQFGS